jgi:hypothetical protein
MYASHDVPKQDIDIGPLCCAVACCAVLQVDVEGREPDVFATARKLLASGQVQNIILEYSPGYYYQVNDRL